MNTPISEHPTVRAHHQRGALQKTSEPLDAASLRQLCLDAGADDVGFVEVDRPALAEERPHIQRAFPHTRSLISIVLRMNRDNVRNLARSIANSEFHHTGDEVNDVARRINLAWISRGRAESFVGVVHAPRPAARKPQVAAGAQALLSIVITAKT